MTGGRNSHLQQRSKSHRQRESFVPTIFEPHSLTLTLDSGGYNDGSGGGGVGIAEITLLN